MTRALPLALLCAGAALAAPAVLERGGLEWRLPAGWREADPPRGARGALTMVLGPERGEGFKLLLTIVRARPGSVDTRALAGEEGRRLLPRSAETSLRIEELHGGEGAGHYYVLTDRAPGPGEFEGLMQGVVVYGERHASFTLLTHAPHTAAREAALAVLRGARRSHAPER